jgi:hypothetical protein
MQSIVVHRTDWIVPRLPRSVVADTVELDRMVIEMALIGSYCTLLVPETGDTAVAISAEAAAVEQLLARMRPGTAGSHPALPDRRKVVVLDSHMSHNWAESTLELWKFGSFHPCLSSAVVAQNVLLADKISVVLGS